MWLCPTNQLSYLSECDETFDLNYFNSMAAWHFIKHLTLSRPLMRISPSSPLSSLPFLFKHHHSVSSHHHCSSSSALRHKSSSTPYLSVLIHCSKDNAVIILPFLLLHLFQLCCQNIYLTSTCFLWLHLQGFAWRSAFMLWCKFCYHGSKWWCQSNNRWGIFINIS